MLVVVCRTFLSSLPLDNEDRGLSLFVEASFGGLVVLGVEIETVFKSDFLGGVKSSPVGAFELVTGY